ncbi:MAG TPA: DUF2730 family protein [Nevskiales bacterium]|nr:DUF2730 family protein [Nevskiales bacterium]
MRIDFQLIGIVVQVTSLLISIGAMLVAWVAKRRAATQAAIDRVDGVINREVADRKHEVRRLEDRVIVLEQHIVHAPKAEDINGLRSEIAALRGNLGEFKGEMRGLTRAVDLMNEHLLNKDRG